MFEIPYIASSKAALDNESDKNRAKKIMQKNNIRTADFFITNPGEYLKEVINTNKISSFYKTSNWWRQ